MRNLKRVLSLALASVMVVSMMVIGAGAANFDDFSDKDKIVNKEAVSVLVELGVLSGKDNGSYDPTGIITRGEMAKIICVVLNKGQDPNLGAVNSNTYTDTIGHWAAPYIEYCTTLGIVAGKGDGTFAPNDTVTASEASKMLLVALGYNAQYESMIGANWAVATNVLANKNGLYDGLTLDVSAGLTRDNAAQMMYNALDAKVVAYDYSVIPNGDSVSAIATAKETGKTLLEDKFGAVKVTGVVIRNEIGSVDGTNPLDEGETYIDVTNYAADGSDEQDQMKTGKYNVSTSKDLLGKSVSIYVKPGNSSLTTQAKVLGSAIEGENTVVTLTSGSTSKDIEKRLSDEDMKIVTSARDPKDDTVFVTNYTKTGLFDGTKKTVNGVAIVAIDNDDDGKADYVLQNFEVFGKVTSYNTKDDGTITVSASSIGSYDGLSYGFMDDSNDPVVYNYSSVTVDDSADVVGFDDVAKNDYVFAQEIGGKLYVRKAESVELTPSATQGDNFKVDGETYKKAGTVNEVDEDGNTTLSAAVEIDEAAKVYMDAHGYVVFVTDVNTTLDYLFVEAATYNKVDDVRAKVVFADGSTDTVTITKLGDNDITGVDHATDPDEGDVATNPVKDGEIYSYTVSNGKYKLTAPEDSKALTTGIKQDKATLESGLYADNSTVFVVYNGSSWNVYTGINNVPDLGKLNGTFSARAEFGDDNYAEVVFVTVSDLSGTSALENSIYVLNEKPNVTKDKNGDKVYTYTVVYKGEKVEMKANGRLTLSNDTGLYLGTSVNGSDEITAAGTFVASSTADRAEKGVIELATAMSVPDGNGGTDSISSFTVNKETKFLAIDDEKVTEVDLDYITVGKDQINIIPDKDNHELAAYVFILK